MKKSLATLGQEVETPSPSGVKAKMRETDQRGTLRLCGPQVRNSNWVLKTQKQVKVCGLMRGNCGAWGESKT